MGPGYKIMSKVKWLMGKIAVIKSQNFKHAIKSKIGLVDARKLAFAPHINIGVFSLEKKSQCWENWQKNLAKTLSSGQIFGSEGLAINMSVYIDEVETEFLPLNCNAFGAKLIPPTAIWVSKTIIKIGIEMNNTTIRKKFKAYYNMSKIDFLSLTISDQSKNIDQ